MTSIIADMNFVVVIAQIGSLLEMKLDDSEGQPNIQAMDLRAVSHRPLHADSMASVSSSRVFPRA
jgi:hypothetical protein